MFEDHLNQAPTSQHLLKAQMATLLMEAKSDSAKALRDEIMPRLNQSKVEASDKKSRKPSAKALLAQQQTLDAILADIISASANVEALGYCYRSSNRQAFTDEPTRATARAFIWQMKALKAIGFVDVVDGLRAVDDWDDGEKYKLFQVAARYRASPVLLTMTQRHGVTVSDIEHHYSKTSNSVATDTVLLRASSSRKQKGRLRKAPATEEFKGLQAQVASINAIYVKYHFEGMSNPTVHRLFNCADDPETYQFNKGGRLYGDFQNNDPDERKKIRIDGEPVIELDLKASHLTILYHITETPMPEGDLYHVEGLPRAVVKAAITTMMGRGMATFSKWSEDMRNHIADGCGEEALRKAQTLRSRFPAKATCDKVKERHGAALNHLSKGNLDWADLQFVESQVLIDAILDLGENHGVPALPVHDAIIVPQKDVEVSRRCLQDAFRRVTGGSVLIEAK